MEISVRPATPDDIEPLCRLRAEAEEWLASRGIEQWGRGFLPADMVRVQVLDG